MCWILVFSILEAAYVFSESQHSAAKVCVLCWFSVLISLFLPLYGQGQRHLYLLPEYKSTMHLSILVGKPEGKRPMGRPRRRWEDNIKMDLQEVGGGCEDWIELARNRDRWRALVSTVMNLRVPKMRRISWLFAEPVSFSRRTLLHGVSK